MQGILRGKALEGFSVGADLVQHIWMCDDVPFDIDRYLFLRSSSQRSALESTMLSAGPADPMSCDVASVVDDASLPPGAPRSVYIKGMRCTHTPTLLFDYDLRKYEAESRDRVGGLTNEVLRREVLHSWWSLLLSKNANREAWQPLAPEALHCAGLLLSRLIDASIACPDIPFLEAQILQPTRSSSSEEWRVFVARGLSEAFRRVYGPEARPLRLRASLAEEDTYRVLELTPVVLPEQLYRVVSSNGIVRCAEAERHVALLSCAQNLAGGLGRIEVGEPLTSIAKTVCTALQPLIWEPGPLFGRQFLVSYYDSHKLPEWQATLSRQEPLLLSGVGPASTFHINGFPTSPALFAPKGGRWQSGWAHCNGWWSLSEEMVGGLDKLSRGVPLHLSVPLKGLFFACEWLASCL